MYNVFQGNSLNTQVLPIKSNLINFSAFNELLSPINFRSFSIKYVSEGCEKYTVNGNPYFVKKGEYLLANHFSEGFVEIESHHLVKGICIDVSPRLISEVISSYLSPEIPVEDIPDDDFFNSPDFLENQYHSKNTKTGQLLQSLNCDIFKNRLILSWEKGEAMEDTLVNEKIEERIRFWTNRVEMAEAADLYFYNQPIEALNGGVRVQVRGREMLMFASYSYLGLIGHPKINAAAKAAIDEYGTGTHGVRLLAGTLKLHRDLEATIARFKGTADAVTFSSGYVTNLTAISTLVGRHDSVICDKLNHASIVDGCLLSGATLLRFRHNDKIFVFLEIKHISQCFAYFFIF